MCIVLSLLLTGTWIGWFVRRILRDISHRQCTDWASVAARLSFLEHAKRAERFISEIRRHEKRPAINHTNVRTISGCRTKYIGAKYS